MKSFIDFVRTYSNSLSEFLRQVMYVGIAFELINWTSAQQAVVLAAISAGLALFVSKQTVASNKVDNIVDKGMERAAKMDMMKDKEGE